MPLKWVLSAVALLALSAGLVMTAPIPTSNLPEPIPTRQDLFEIPFRIPPVQDPTDTPVNVRLYVSDDSGINYKLHSTVEPAKGKFVFRAPHDGEYWFLIRTVDAANRVRPEGSTPELRVIVDTMLPRLDLQVARGPSGEVVASWQMLDANIKAETLKLEFQVGNNPTWSLVSLDPNSSGGAVARAGGASWFVPGSDEVRIRAEVSDLAGNVGRTNATVKPGGTSAGTPVPNAPAVNPAPIANGPSAKPNQTANNAAPNNNGGITTSSGLWPANASDVPWNRDRGQPAQQPAVGPSGLPSYAQQQAAQQQATQQAGQYQSTQYPPNQPQSSPFQTTPYQASQSQPLQQPVSNNVPSDNAGANSSNPWNNAGNNSFGTPSPINPPIASQYDGGYQPTSGANMNPGVILPPGERPRMVSGRSFEMEYEVDSIGPSGIARVELWGSRDGGRTWSSFGTDPDSRSPMRINVDGEGLYGFRIAVQSGSGLGGAAPLPGDPPEVWVGVDLTKPNGRLVGADAGTGDRAGELVIRWDASDAGLAQRPITLYFSPQPGGPWYPIAAGLENTGSYGWRLDNRIPNIVYLRLEIRDEASNVTLVDGPAPVTLEQAKPTGRIRDVRPSSESAKAATNFSRR